MKKEGPLNSETRALIRDWYSRQAIMISHHGHTFESIFAEFEKGDRPGYIRVSCPFHTCRIQIDEIEVPDVWRANFLWQGP